MKSILYIFMQKKSVIFSKKLCIKLHVTVCNRCGANTGKVSQLIFTAVKEVSCEKVSDISVF